MGEYARRLSDGAEIKIGTCESMYYLRFDQRSQVAPLSCSLDVNDSETVLAIRFRFPWPDEDGREPGDMGHPDYLRAVAVHGLKAPAAIEHESVSFVSSSPGYVTSLPCPESPDYTGPTVHRNAFPGAVQLVQQKLLADGRLVPVCRCGGCGTLWRLEERHEIEKLVIALRHEADRLEHAGAYNGTGQADRSWWDKVADRVAAGARLEAR